MDKFQAGKFKRARPQISARASEPLTIEIINNTRGGIEGEIWERGDWGANSSPVCSLIHDVRWVFLLFKLFFAVKILQISFQIV